MMSARRRGTISTSIGSSPITRSASISSRIFIEPISAVKDEPERPATMMAVRSTPTSRSVRMPTRSTTNGVAPNFRSWKMPCWATMQPTRNEISAMIGTPRKAISSSWCTSDGPRKRRGRVATRTMAMTTSPRKLMPGREILAGCNDRLPDLGQGSRSASCASPRDWAGSRDRRPRSEGCGARSARRRSRPNGRWRRDRAWSGRAPRRRACRAVRPRRDRR